MVMALKLTMIIATMVTMVLGMVTTGVMVIAMLDNGDDDDHRSRGTADDGDTW